MSTITVPAIYAGQPDATLTVEQDSYGDSYTLTLAVAGRVIAQGEGFRPGAYCDFGDGDAAAHTAQTFGSFLAHALESSDEDAREGWSVLADDASDWTDALALCGEDEYGTCEMCGDPIDCCQGHGPRAVEVEERARMVCVIDGVTYRWGGGEYVELHADAEAAPFDLFNVWDYSAGAPTIARTLDGFEARCVEFAQGE